MVAFVVRQMTMIHANVFCRKLTVSLYGVFNEATFFSGLFKMSIVYFTV